MKKLLEIHFVCNQEIKKYHI